MVGNEFSGGGGGKSFPSNHEDSAIKPNGARSFDGYLEESPTKQTICKGALGTYLHLVSSSNLKFLINGPTKTISL